MHLLTRASFILGSLFLFTGFATNVIETRDRAYEIQLVSQASGASERDACYFHGDLMKSEYFSSFGEARVFFKPSPNATLFTAETRQTKLGKIKWVGAFAGNRIEAAVIWYKVGMPPIIYMGKGFLKNTEQEKA